jgi:hypothetical protein
LILPVTLASFDVKLNQDNQAVLTWSTLSEHNTHRFDIQYSIDGTNFNTVHAVNANSPDGASYFEIHKETTIGFNYYRLKIIDLDNTFRYSQSRVIRTENTEEILNIFPTIAQAGKYAYIQVTWYPKIERQAAYINIMDISGRQRYKELILIGQNFVDISGLTPGVYYLTITDYSGTNIVKRIVITH